jgi:hypothetical protein
MKKPEFVRITKSKETHIHATIKCVYDLIEFTDWLAGQNLPGDTTVQFNGYYELNIHRSVDDVTSQTLFDELHDHVEQKISDYNWPEKDRRKRDREWRGPHYGM